MTETTSNPAEGMEGQGQGQAAELERLVAAAQNAMTDRMLERLVGTTNNGLELLDRLNDEETLDAFHTIITGITDLHRIGALDTAFEMVRLIHGARAAMTDNMVERMFAFIEHIMNSLATEEIAALAHETKGALEDSLDECAASGRASGGMFTIMSMMNKPEAVETMKFLLNFGCKLRERASTLQQVSDENP